MCAVGGFHLLPVGGDGGGGYGCDFAYGAGEGGKGIGQQIPLAGKACDIAGSGVDRAPLFDLCQHFSGINGGDQVAFGGGNLLHRQLS